MMSSADLCRSVLVTCFDKDLPYILLGLGDGQLLSWRLHARNGERCGV